MIRLIRALFATPEAERDPAAWATRYAAHVGVGAALWLIVQVWADPFPATAAVAALMAAWEVAQWRGGARMAWDGLLDWCGVTLAAAALWAVADGQIGWAAFSGAAVVATLAAGVWRRTA